MISLIHPSRGRPEKSVETFKKWMSHSIANKEVEFILSIDEDEPTDHPYIKNSMYVTLYTAAMFTHGYQYKIVSSKNRSAVDAINNGAKVATGDIFIVVSDDTDPIQDWDEKILQHKLNEVDWIMKTQDGIQPWIITMPIMDRAYYNRFGYIYYPDYLHMFCDTELTCVADITGRKIKSNLLFPHKHYSVTKEQPDAINKKADSTWAQGEKLFLERYKRNFDLPKGGKIEGQNMIDWLIRKGQTV